MMEDRELERLAQHLGKAAEHRIDAERVAERVVDRLRREGPEPGVSSPWFARRVVRRTIQIAAVLAVVITGGVFLRDTGVPTDGPPQFAVPLVLDDLSESELTDVLDSLEFAGPVQQVGRAGIDDLSDSELEELLAMMAS